MTIQAPLARVVSPVSTERRPKKKVLFSTDVEEIPSREPGDTWMRAEDYSWPTPSCDSKTVLLDPLEPSIDLAPAMTQQVPGSPVLMHRKKRSSFLQTTKNALSRRPSKKRPISPAAHLFDIPIPAPKSSMIDLDLALGPQPSLRHKKSGSLGTFSALPASPSKPKAWHRRSDSAPADILFSFSPRPASPDSRKRKMSSIVEHPNISTGPLEIVEVRMDAADGFQARRLGFPDVMSDDMIFGEPGEMVSTRDSADSSDSPAVMALKGNAAGDYLSNKSKKGWKGVLHRLLH